MIRWLLSIGFAFALFLITIILLIPMIEFSLLEIWYEVQPLPGVRQITWLNNFSDTALYCGIIALALTIIWHTVGYYFYKIKNWRMTRGNRIVWGLIFGIMILVVIVFGWLYTKPTQDKGYYLALLFYFLNAIFIYYFSSAILSPATVKYAPVWSTIFTTRRFYRN